MASELTAEVVREHRAHRRLEIFRLRQQGCTFTEIAKKFGVTRQAVRLQYYRVAEEPKIDLEELGL
jgi:transcriptional regulator